MIHILVSQFKCPNDLVLKVESIDHWRDGKSGRYFYFSESDLSKKIGPYWGGRQGTKFHVAQSGSKNRDGKGLFGKTKEHMEEDYGDLAKAIGKWEMQSNLYVNCIKIH